MKTAINFNASAFQYNEYLIVLTPNEHTSDHINSVKKEFSVKFKTSLVSYKPQIIILQFIQFEMIEERLLNHLKNISVCYKSFLIKLNDYGSFPSHTIFINIESQLQVRNLVTQLKSVERILNLDKENKAHFFDHFYISVATKLLPWQYEKAWLEYSKAHFAGSFMVDGLTILKRKVEHFTDHFQPKGSYKFLKRFQFMNSPVTTAQGELFTYFFDYNSHSIKKI